MKIRKFTYTRPDEDGETQFGVSVALTNSTEHTVDLIQQKMVFQDKSGLPLCSSESDQECNLDPDESYGFEDNYCGYTKSSLFSGSLEEAQVSISTRLCKLNFVKGPQLDISSNAMDVRGVSEPFTVCDVLEVSGISAWLTEPDEDGDYYLEVKSSLRNLTEQAIAKWCIKARLVDWRGRGLGESEAEGFLHGGSRSVGFADISFWDVKGKKLNGAQLHFEVSAFTELVTLGISASNPSLLVESDEDDNVPPRRAIASFPDPDGTITNSIGMKLVPIAAGEYLMGSPDDCPLGNADEEFQHLVRITKPFLIGMHQVTQTQFEQVMGRNPSRFKGADYPVEFLSWQESHEFCQRLSGVAEEQASGRKYRLPTEAEWEYACRAGTSTPYNTGESLREVDARFAGLSRHSPKPAASVGSYPPNAWGLFDMHGNVWEWTSDWFSDSWYRKSPVEDPQGPESGTHHTLRGGSASVEGHECYSAIRGEAPRDKPEPRNRNQRFALYGDFGVRVVCELVAPS